MLAWLSVWSEVQTCIWSSRCHFHSLSLASLKSRLVLPFWYWLTRVVPDKGPLNGCVCVCCWHCWIIRRTAYAIIVLKRCNVRLSVRPSVYPFSVPEKARAAVAKPRSGGRWALVDCMWHAGRVNFGLTVRRSNVLVIMFWFSVSGRILSIINGIMTDWLNVFIMTSDKPQMKLQCMQII